jgi:hypothetical protein
MASAEEYDSSDKVLFVCAKYKHVIMELAKVSM